MKDDDADVNDYQWTGYPSLTYEVPIDGYDGRISLQTLMRRVARGCLHFVQVSSPLAPTALFHSLVFAVSWYSDPPRPHHPPLHRGSYLGNLAASAHRRVIVPTPALGSPKFPASLMEYCALVFFPHITSSVRLERLDVVPVFVRFTAFVPSS